MSRLRSKVTLINNLIEMRTKIQFWPQQYPSWLASLIGECCILLVGTRQDPEQEEQAKSYIEDAINEVKGHNKGSLNPTETVRKALRSFDLDPADPMEAIKRWGKVTFNDNWIQDQVK